MSSAPSTGTIELRADFPNSDMRLVPGQTVTVVGPPSTRSPGATVVPRDAVNLGPENSFRAGGRQGRQGLVQDRSRC